MNNIEKIVILRTTLEGATKLLIQINKQFHLPTLTSAIKICTETLELIDFESKDIGK